MPPCALTSLTHSWYPSSVRWPSVEVEPVRETGAPNSRVPLVLVPGPLLLLLLPQAVSTKGNNNTNRATTGRALRTTLNVDDVGSCKRDEKNVSERIFIGCSSIHADRQLFAGMYRHMPIRDVGTYWLDSSHA